MTFLIRNSAIYSNNTTVSPCKVCGWSDCFIFNFSLCCDNLQIANFIHCPDALSWCWTTVDMFMVRKLNATIMCTWICIKFINFSFSCTLVFIGAFFNYTTQFSSLVKVQVFKFNISYTVVYTCRYFLSSHYTISTVLSGYGFTCLTFVVLWYTCRWLLFITLHNC